MNKVKFTATTYHLDHITTALNCFTTNTTNKDFILVHIDQDGLSFIKQFNHNLKIQLLLSFELFNTYEFNQHTTGNNNESEQLCLKLNHLLNSLNILNKDLNDAIQCTLSYDGYGTPFILMFEETYIEETIKYPTYLLNESNDINGLDLQKNHLLLECIVKGEIFHNALLDLKDINCSECYLYAKLSSNNENDNILALISKSDLGYSKVILPNNKSIIERFNVWDTLPYNNGNLNATNDNAEEEEQRDLLYDQPIIAYFDFNTFDRIRSSCKIASKILLRLDRANILNVNILSQTDDIMVTNNLSNKKLNNNNVNRINNNNNNNNLQLPQDYPGIIIEISLSAKEPLDDIAIEDIELFMNTTTKTMKNVITRKRMGIYDNSNLNKDNKIRNITNDRSIDNSTFNIFSNANIGNNANNNQKDHEEEQQEENNDQPFATDANNIPLFF